MELMQTGVMEMPVPAEVGRIATELMNKCFISTIHTTGTNLKINNWLKTNSRSPSICHMFMSMVKFTLLDRTRVRMCAS